MAMRRPRTWVISRSDLASRSSPSNWISPPTMRAGRGTRRKSARLDTVLPLPLSPTSPSVSCAPTSKSTPSTARETPPCPKKCTHRPRAVSSGLRASAAALALLLEAGIECIGEPVCDEVEAEHGDEDRCARRDGGPRRDLERFIVEVEHLPPAHGLRVAEAEEAHHGLGQDGAADAERDEHDEGGQGIGQDVAEHDVE